MVVVVMVCVVVVAVVVVPFSCTLHNLYYRNSSRFSTTRPVDPWWGCVAYGDGT